MFFAILHFFFFLQYCVILCCLYCCKFKYVLSPCVVVRFCFVRLFCDSCLSDHAAYYCEFSYNWLIFWCFLWWCVIFYFLIGIFYEITSCRSRHVISRYSSCQLLFGLNMSSFYHYNRNDNCQFFLVSC